MKIVRTGRYYKAAGSKLCICAAFNGLTELILTNLVLKSKKKIHHSNVGSEMSCCNDFKSRRFHLRKF